ncbi:MAG: NAD(P)-dependent oxidoreductase [Oscillatoriales cyanobacterium]|nr:MAG: NAD(P)-dependent oxidoreductase [Oscillatoriales cyanobacterium]
MTKKIFITGASGCIGHYMAETLIQQTNHELYLLVRNPDKLKFDWKARSGINIIQGDMKDIDRHSELLQTIDVAILAATAWGGTQEVFDVNVTKTLRLIQLLSPQTCEQVIYFSTARLTNVPPITALYPTLVLGGDAEKPVSHLSSGLPLVAKWIGLIRWLKADGSFHFIHGADIATVVNYLVEHPSDSEEPRHFVLGNPAITANEVVEQACKYLHTKIFFRITLSPWLADFFIWLFRIQMAAWDRFCISYRHFTYQNLVNPESIGLPSYCGTVADMLRTSGIPDKNTK